MSTQTRRQEPQEPISPDAAEDLPQPPEIRRRLRLQPYQYVGIPLLMLIPLLALFNVFGEANDTAVSRDGGVTLSIEYVNRAHYEAYNHAIVTVTNESGGALENAALEFDRLLVDKFSQVTFNPSLEMVTQTAYIVDLGTVPDGAARTVTLDYQNDHNGEQRGTVRLTAGGAPVVQVEMKIFVFP